MYCLESKEEWDLIHPDDLWIYNKLILSTKLGYKCGPAGVPVPYPGHYIVRPSMNLMGMGRNAEILWLEGNTDHLYPSDFWCEVFNGQHLSVDFHKKEAKLVILGEKDDDQPLYKWKKWQKVSKKVKFPKILQKLKGKYDWINCEFIGNHLIEVHFRQNPDFRYGNSIAIPIWNDKIEKSQEYRYIKDEDYLRKGFYID